MTGGSPLAAYAAFQVRDGVVRAAVAVLLFLGMGGLPLWIFVTNNTLAVVRQPGSAQQMAVQMYTQTMSLAMTFGAVLLMSGLIALDREKQHVRFLFAAPVAPWRYYLQQFLLSGALFVALSSLMPLGFSAVITPVPVLAVVRSAALYALLFGPLAMLCGALVNRDGLLLIVVALASAILQPLERLGQLPGLAGLVANALPPLAAADEVRSAWLAGRIASGGDLRLVLGYGLGMLVAALAVVRRAPLVR